MTLDEEFGLYDRARARAYLEKKGCPAEAVDYAANADILMAGRRWEPTNDAGQPAILLPVWDGESTVNICAWLPADPKVFFMRTDGDHVLGVYNLRMAITYRQPIQVWDTPQQWLEKGMVGCVPLSWDARKSFMGIREIEASPQMFKSIMESMGEMYPVPKNVAPRPEVK